MPFVAPSLAQPVINSVAGGAPGAVLQKKINKDTCEAFPHQSSFANVKSFIEACAMSVEGKTLPEGDATSTASASSAAAAAQLLHETPLKPLLTAIVGTLFPYLHSTVDSIPLQDMKAQRFGNKAFRDFCQKISDELLNGFVKTTFIPVLTDLRKNSMTNENGEPAPMASTVCNELYEYLLDSFGNAQRIDYGTGHELHFMCFCYVAIVNSIGVPPSPSSDEAEGKSETSAGFKEGLADLTLVVFPTYLAFVRRLQKHYSLEPAGSHGVWGLDDYHHLPFLFGASQLVGSEPSILPKHISEKPIVDKLRNKYLYFEMIGWIMDNKKGPFHEHSPILYNVSGIEEWARIRQGMLKMYVAEVMSRFAVVQHFLFGPTLPWKE